MSKELKKLKMELKKSKSRTSTWRKRSNEKDIEINQLKDQIVKDEEEYLKTINNKKPREKKAEEERIVELIEKIFGVGYKILNGVRDVVSESFDKNVEKVIARINIKIVKEVKNTLNKLIKFIEEEHPYPEDLFPNKNGKLARVGYNSCIHNVKKFMSDI